MPQPQPLQEFEEEKNAVLKASRQKKFLQFCSDLHLFIVGHLKISQKDIAYDNNNGGFIIEIEIPILTIAAKLKELGVTCQDENFEILAEKLQKNGYLILPTLKATKQYKNGLMSAIKLVKNPNGDINERTNHIGFYMTETDIPL
jgi:hypothetical protein